MGINHSNLSEEEWGLVKQRPITDAKIERVWFSEDGKFHMELSYPR